LHRSHLALLALFALLALLATLATASSHAAPLRIFIRAGDDTYEPGVHDHRRFLTDWTDLLAARGALVKGGLTFPTAAQLAETDVLVMFAAGAGSIHGAERTRLLEFLERGGGIVALHDAIGGDDPNWLKTIVGGAWEEGHSQEHRAEVGLFFGGRRHAITRGAITFDVDDELYYDLRLDRGIRVLATGFHSVFSITPQMWVVEKDGYRAFVSLPGHRAATFDHPAYRTLLLRGIAWAGRRDVDLLTRKDEVARLRYPPGGPLHPGDAARPFDLHPIWWPPSPS